MHVGAHRSIVTDDAEENPRDMGKGMKSKQVGCTGKTKIITLDSSGGEEEDEMAGFVVSDSEEDKQEYNQQWLKQAILHDDYDDLRMGAASGAGSRTGSSPRKAQHRAEAATERAAAGNKGKRQSRMELVRHEAFVAVSEGDAQRLKQMLEADRKKLRVREKGQGLLHAAVAGGELECVQVLLHMGAAKDDRDDSSDTQVSLACSAPCICVCVLRQRVAACACVQSCLGQVCVMGVDGWMDGWGCGAVVWCGVVWCGVQGCSLSWLGLLLQMTPLLSALERRETGIASLLLDKHADVLKADSEKTLPLHMAAAACGVTLVERILRYH